MSLRNTVPVIALAFGVLGCARDQDAPPQEETKGADGSGTDPNTLDTTVTDPTSDGSGDPVTTASGNESGTTGNECLGAEGCYACDPAHNVQLLDHCTDADCEPFANTPERLPLLDADGSLPPIP
jgi:hypothetical protein